MITHLLEAFAVVGVLKTMETDNALAYTSAKMCDFFSAYGINHITGNQYNSTGQVIIERANRALKDNKLECPATEAGWGGRDLSGGGKGYWVHSWWWRMDTGGGMGLRTLHEGKTNTKMCESVIVLSL